MTHKEIEIYRKRLIDVKKIEHSGARNKAFIELVKELGASGWAKDMESAEERDVEYIRSIHQALQTATMVDMCKTASKNYMIALTASIVSILAMAAAWAAVLTK